jgi:hypothetical protein
MLLKITESILKKQEWQFYLFEDSSLRIDVNGQAARWITLVKCIDEHQQLLVYSICPNKTPEAKFVQVQEFLTRANFGLKFGNFEFDYDDGEIRFKTSVQFEGDFDFTLMIEECISLNIATFDRYLSGILQVIFTDISPKEAIASIESVSE